MAFNMYDDVKTLMYHQVFKLAFLTPSFCGMTESARPVNCSRPFSQWSLILKEITPCAKKEIWQRKTTIKQLQSTLIEQSLSQ